MCLNSLHVTTSAECQMQWWIDSYVLTGPMGPLHNVACSLGNLPPPSCSDPCSWIDKSTLWSVGDSMTKFPGSYLNYGARVRTIRSYPSNHRRMWFLGAFARFRKVIINCFMSVRKEQLSSHSRDIHEIHCLRIFLKIYRENSRSIKTWQE